MNKLEFLDVQILVVNARSALRKGFCSMLRSSSDLFSIYEAADGQQAIWLLHRVQPDLVLLDAALPQVECVDAIRMITSLQPEAKILVVVNTEENFLQAFQAGANGCIFENIEAEELLHAVELILSGYVVCKKLGDGPLDISFSVSHEKTKISSIDMNLTEREVEVLSLIAREHTNTEIAKCLFISRRTVDSHRARLMKKLGTKNTAGLMRIAMQQGLLHNHRPGNHQLAQEV